MPTDAPNLSKHGAFAMAMSPLLWQRFKPDRFDSYSAGEPLNLESLILSKPLLSLLCCTASPTFSSLA